MKVNNQFKKMNFLLRIALVVASGSVFVSNPLLAKPSELKDLRDLQAILEDRSKPAILSPNEPKWGAAPASLPQGAELTVLEGDPNNPGPFLMRLKLPANYKIPAHWNLSDEHITVLSGTLNIGLGDKFDAHKSKTLPAGSFARIPAKTHNYSFVSEETIVQVHGVGPWQIQYLDPNDNPNPIDNELDNTAYRSNTDNGPVLDTLESESAAEEKQLTRNKIK